MLACDYVNILHWDVYRRTRKIARGDHIEGGTRNNTMAYLPIYPSRYVREAAEDSLPFMFITVVKNYGCQESRELIITRVKKQLNVEWQDSYSQSRNTISKYNLESPTVQYI